LSLIDVVESDKRVDNGISSMLVCNSKTYRNNLIGKDFT